MDLGDVTDEDLIRNGLIDPSIPGSMMPFSTQADLQAYREDERRMARNIANDRIYEAVDAFVLPKKPWQK